jgi:hypothetical protein
LSNHEANRANVAVSEPAADDVRAELDAVLRSATFERAPRLQRFLRYIANLTLRGEGDRIHESLIAQEVFERDSDYSPTEDSIVRRQAHALRAKLERFYDTEGVDHDLLIELPIGHYVPVFRHRPETKAHVQPHAEIPATAPEGPRPVPPTRSRRAMVQIAALLVTLAFGVAVGSLAQKRRAEIARAETTQAIQDVWGPWLSKTRSVVVCFTNRMTASLRHETEPEKRLRDGWYLPEPSEGSALFRQAFGLSNEGRLNVLPEQVMVKLGDAQAATRIGAFFGEHKIPLRTLEARHLTWDVLRRESIVLLGQSDIHHNGINRWVALLLEKYPFQPAAPTRDEERRIVNTAPLPGEPKAFLRAAADQPGHVDEMVALVSMLPGVDPHRELLLISGIDAPATDMAAEFLTNPETLADLAKRLTTQNRGHSPRHFQLVLRAEVRENVPTRAVIVALRML